MLQPKQITHDELVAIGAKWLLSKKRVPIVLTELQSVWSWEIPDILGFTSCYSILLEVKVSRSDFLADKAKPERNGSATGIGTYRLYLCPEGLIQPDELPSKWGLLYFNGKSIQEIVFPQGIAFRNSGMEHDSDIQAERSFLYSALRRKR